MRLIILQWNEEWSLKLWTQFMQSLHIKKLQKIQDFNIVWGFEPMTSWYRCNALRNQLLWSHWCWELVNYVFTFPWKRWVWHNSLWELQKWNQMNNDPRSCEHNLGNKIKCCRPFEALTPSHYPFSPQNRQHKPWSSWLFRLLALIENPDSYT